MCISKSGEPHRYRYILLAKDPEMLAICQSLLERRSHKRPVHSWLYNAFPAIDNTHTINHHPRG